MTRTADVFAAPAFGAGDSLARLAPAGRSVLLVLLLLGAGYVLGRVVGMLVERVASRMLANRPTAARELNAALRVVGVSVPPQRVARWLAFIAVVTVFITEAARRAGLLELAAFLDRVAAAMPLIFIVLALLFGGALLGETLGRLIGELARRSGVMAPALAGAITRAIVLVTIAQVALQTAGLEMGLPVLLVALAVAAALALVVIALTLGARGLLENLLAARYVEELFIEGQAVSFRGEPAQVRAIGLLATVLRTGSGIDATVPNATFVREAM